MENAELVRLTLIFPPELEARLIERVLEFSPAVPFTTWRGEGHGAGFAQASTREQVRGRVARGLLTLVLDQGGAEALLDFIRQQLPNPHVVWWMEPLLASGRLT